MYKFTSTAEQVLINELARIRTLRLLKTRIVAEGALLTRNAVERRISQGVNSAGQMMQTHGAARIGVYSSRHGAARRERGLQTGRIDFSFSGDLLDNWSVLVGSSGNVSMGFRSDEQARKAGELEDYFGDAFVATDSEVALSTAYIQQRTDNIFGK